MRSETSLRFASSTLPSSSSLSSCKLDKPRAPRLLEAVLPSVEFAVDKGLPHACVLPPLFGMPDVPERSCTSLAMVMDAVVVIVTVDYCCCSHRWQLVSPMID